MIQDEFGQLITSPPSLSIAPGGVKTFNLRIECRAGMRITAENAPGIEFAVRAAPGDAWIPITNGGFFEIGGFAPAVKLFYFRVTAAADASGDRIDKIRVAFG